MGSSASRFGGGCCGGGCCVKDAGNPPPAEATKRTSAEMREIIGRSTGCKDIHLADRDYGCYSRTALERFLTSDTVNEIKYRPEVFDCDNYTLALAGRETEWYAQREDLLGSSFGIVHGDIRKAEGDTEQRYHAMNFLVDDDGVFWLIEPQTDEIYEPTASSTFWFTYC